MLCKYFPLLLMLIVILCCMQNCLKQNCPDCPDDILRHAEDFMCKDFTQATATPQL